MPNFKFVNANNIPYVPDRFLSVGSVNLRSEITDLNGIDDPSIDLSTKLGNSFVLRVPFITTDATQEECIKAHQKGGMGVLSNNPEKIESSTKMMEVLTDLKNRGVRIGFTIGTHPDDDLIVSSVLALGIKNPLVFVKSKIDNYRKTIEQVRRLSLKYRSDIDIMAGPCTSISMLLALVQAGVQSVYIPTTNNVNLNLSMRHAVYSLQRNITLVGWGCGFAENIIASGIDILDTNAFLTDNFFVDFLKQAMVSTNSKNLLDFANNTVFMEVPS